MTHFVRMSIQFFACGLSAAGLFVAAPHVAQAQGNNVVMALDGMIVNNTGGGQPNWGGFGRFAYAQPTTMITIGNPTTAGLGRYDAFTIAEPGIDGSGVGVNFTIGNINSPVDPFEGVVSPVTNEMFPILDLATFGANFDPKLYVAELVYKPLAGNTANQLNMTLDTTDGFTADGLRRGEQWQWNFNNLMTDYAAAAKDADGFATARIAGGALLGPNGERTAGYGGANAPSHMYATAPLPAGQAGDDAADFDNFEGGPLPVPNGAVQIHLQTVYGTQTAADGADNWEIKALRVIKLNPDPLEVARLDGKSGFGLRFGSPFVRNTDTAINIGGIDYLPNNTDQLQRFDANGFLPNNAFRINTDDDGAIGGFGVFQSAASTVFDGTNASLEIRARLTAPAAGQAASVQVVAKDKDGNGTADVGDFGGDEYHFNVALNQFNEATMTTISIPFASATIEQAQEFATPGDGQRTNFNLYYLGMLTDQGAGLVDMEIEYVRILLPAPPGVLGDYNNNGTVDAADYVLWRNGGPLQNDPTPGLQPEDYNFWRSRFGATSGGGAIAGAGSVPEPASWLLAAMSLGLLGTWRRRRR